VDFGFKYLRFPHDLLKLDIGLLLPLPYPRPETKSILPPKEGNSIDKGVQHDWIAKIPKFPLCYEIWFEFMPWVELLP